MSQLTTTLPTTDFVVNPKTGEAFISQRKTAELLGVATGTLKSWLHRNHQSYSKTNGLDAKMLQYASTYFSLDSSAKTEEAVRFLSVLAKAGAKAFIYHEAGYSVSASPIRHVALPQDYVNALRALADETEAKILLLEENHEKRIETDCSDAYYTVRKVRSVNFDLKIDPKPLLRVSEKMELSVKKVFDLYEQQANAYHRLVWEEVYPDAILPM